jgi:putative ABC transport system permease protein
VIPAKPIAGRAGLFMRFRTMARAGVRMMFHDWLKMAGTMLGVVFAVVLSNQQLGTFLGLLYKNVMFVRNTPAEIWIVPPGAETVQGGKVIPYSDVLAARTGPGVAQAEPIVLATATIALPGGGSEPLNLVGVSYPTYLGGPWNVIVGSTQVLNRPDTMVFEDSERDTLGGLNIGSVREVNGHKVTVGAFTWGLVPFGPSYAFADYELARELTKLPRDQANYGLVKLNPGVDPKAAKAELLKRVSKDTQILTKQEFERIIVVNILTKTAIGITFGTSTVFGLVVGFVIVSLSMFSSVVDNIREFGTLKAIGATTFDLAILLFVQSVLYGVLGSIVGLFLVSRMALGIRSAKLALNLPPQLTFGTVVVMVLMCIMASSLALLRIRKVEPAMVFR